MIFSQFRLLSLFHLISNVIKIVSCLYTTHELQLHDHKIQKYRHTQNSIHTTPYFRLLLCLSSANLIYYSDSLLGLIDPKIIFQTDRNSQEFKYRLSSLFING